MLKNIEGNVLFVDGANTYYKKQNYDWGGCSITLEKATDLTPDELEIMKVVTPSDYPFYNEICGDYISATHYIEYILKHIYKDKDYDERVIDVATQLVDDNFYYLLGDHDMDIGFKKYFAVVNAIDDLIAGLYIDTDFNIENELRWDSREKPDDINEWDFYEIMEWLQHNPGDYDMVDNDTIIEIDWNHIGSGSSRMGIPSRTIGDNYISMSRSEGE